MTSLWLDRPHPQVEDAFPADDAFQDVVVGAGITGLTTALLLARAGRRVAVLEARHYGAVTTGRTTAKASVLQATKLSRMLKAQPRAKAAAYLEANLEGLAWLRRFCGEHGVQTQTRTAGTFAATASERSAARGEYDAASALGLDVHWTDDLDLPFPTHGAVLLDGQLQFDPMALLDAMVEQVRAHGGTLHEGQRVRSVSKTGVPSLQLDTGRTVSAESMVLATGVPILDRAFTFAKVEPKRSYLVAYTHPDAPEGMYLSAGSSNRSYRDVPATDGGPGFLAGGSGHTVGRARSEARHLDELRSWATGHFPGAVETHAWSAQDYSSYDGLPLVGRLPLGRDRIFYATGYDKWGMTNAVAASLQLAAEILGGEAPAWARELGDRSPRPQIALNLGGMNAKVGLAEAVATVAAERAAAPDSVPEGTGVVGRDNLVPTGVSTVDGKTCRVTAICTHVGGTLKWNDAEKSWDCPLHGSRFAPDGQVLEGPATRPLQRRDSGEPGPVRE